MTKPTAAQRSTVTRALNDAGILIPRELLDDLTAVVLSYPGERDSAIADLRRRYIDLDRFLATKLVDLATEALE